VCGNFTIASEKKVFLPAAHGLSLASHCGVSVQFFSEPVGQGNNASTKKKCTER
jgi:hypothetical protein